MGSIKTTEKEIVDYWFKVVDEYELSIDVSEAIERCWRCGYEAQLDRCHIVSKSLGDNDAPANFFLLCKRCHLEKPNVTDPEIMWDWLKAYATPFYGTFWVIEVFKEYESMYGKILFDELGKRNIKSVELIKQIVEEEYKRTPIHYVHPYLNRATLAGVLHVVLKKYDKDFRKQ